MGLFAWQIDGIVRVNLIAMFGRFLGKATGQFLIEMQVYCVLVSKFYSMQLVTFALREIFILMY